LNSPCEKFANDPLMLHFHAGFRFKTLEIKVNQEFLSRVHRFVSIELKKWLKPGYYTNRRETQGRKDMKQAYNLWIGICLMLLAGSAVADKTRQNIIIILVDALRPDHISYFGYPCAMTPNIDRIAESGVVFMDATTSIPLTNPALATLLTSQPISRTGVNRNGISLLPDNPTLAEILKANGYQTYAVVSCWALYHNRSGLHKGFDHYIDSGTSLSLELDAKQVTARAIGLVDSQMNEPFFLFVGYSEPHQPHQLYPDLSGSEKTCAPDNRTDVEKNYDSEVSYVDYWMGQLLKKLDSHGWLKNSFLIIMSDHGESLGEKNYVGHGRKLYEHILHISLIFSGPRIPEAKKIQRPVYILDIMPTILSYLGLESKTKLAGRDLLPHINQNEPLPEIPMYYETNSIAVLDLPGLKKIGRATPPSAIALRNGNLKIIYDLKKKNWEIYDLARDPKEEHNLFDQQNPEHHKLAEKLLENFKENSASGPHLKLEFTP